MSFCYVDYFVFIYVGLIHDNLRKNCAGKMNVIERNKQLHQILSKINSELEFELPQEIVMRETQSRVNDIFTSNEA